MNRTGVMAMIMSVCAVIVWMNAFTHPVIAVVALVGWSGWLTMICNRARVGLPEGRHRRDVEAVIQQGHVRALAQRRVDELERLAKIWDELEQASLAADTRDLIRVTLLDAKIAGEPVPTWDPPPTQAPLALPSGKVAYSTEDQIARSLGVPPAQLSVARGDEQPSAEIADAVFDRERIGEAMGRLENKPELIKVPDSRSLGKCSKCGVLVYPDSPHLMKKDGSWKCPNTPGWTLPRFVI